MESAVRQELGALSKSGKNSVSREPQKKETQTRANYSAAPTQLALYLRLASMYKAESWQRAVTLDDSTPQRRISELRVWSYEPFIVFASSSSG